ncbi:hypothetical protein ACNQ62_07560 [Sulfitobacter sp. SBS6]|uniref:hypothetical protein n=1 Tax=Sulfitobacter sp. SBS6 TaxID=3401755 RepID=UPI003AAF148D
MGRLLVFVATLALIVAFGAVLVTIIARILDAGRRASTPAHGQEVYRPMAPTPFQKITYAALVVLLFGVSTGWLGGL